jgi:protein TonB
VFKAGRVSALTVSFAFHLALFSALVFVMRRDAHAPDSSARAVEEPLPRMVWLNAPGPGGGGGGGGNEMKEPPRPAQLPGRDTTTMPAAPPRAVDLARPATTEPPPIPQLEVPVATLASATDALPQIGAVGAPPRPTLSQGPGKDGGAGTGKGRGDGPGRGPGLGDGRDGGFGGEAFQPGNGVTMPVEIEKGIPRYTTDAMRARVQGSILIECVVQPEGACTNIRVRRSFDPSFGLEEQAMKAAAEWRFRPGTFRGQPVPVRVTMEIAFALR